MMTRFHDCSWLVVTLSTVLVSGESDPAMEVISADFWVDLELLSPHQKHYGTPSLNKTSPHLFHQLRHPILKLNCVLLLTVFWIPLMSVANTKLVLLHLSMISLMNLQKEYDNGMTHMI